MPTEQDYEKESAERLRRIAEKEKRMEELKADKKENPDKRDVELKELRTSCRQLYVQAKQLAKQGERAMLRETI